MTKTQQTQEAALVELSAEQLEQVSGGLPRGGWETDPEPPIEPAAVKADATS